MAALFLYSLEWGLCSSYSLGSEVHGFLHRFKHFLLFLFPPRCRWGIGYAHPVCQHTTHHVLMYVSHKQGYRGLAVSVGYKQLYLVVLRLGYLGLLVGKHLVASFVGWWLLVVDHCGHVVHFCHLLHILFCVWKKSFYTLCIGKVKHFCHPVNIACLANVLHLVTVVPCSPA